MATAADMHEAIRKRWPSEAYAVLFQVASGTGGHYRRTADAVVFGLWPSRGLDIEGVEVKVSRSDWRREVADPTKAVEFSQYCHRWWIAAPPGIVESGELPVGWGLLELKRGVLRQAVEAPRNAEPKPVGRVFMAAIMRNVQNVELRQVEQVRRQIEQSAEARADQRIRQDLERLQRRIAEFKDATGVDIMTTWNADRIGEALRMVEQGQDYRRTMMRLSHVSTQLREVADMIDAGLSDGDDLGG